MRWFPVLFGTLTVFAIVTTGFAIIQAMQPPPPAGAGPPPPGQTLAWIGWLSSYAAPTSWVGVFSLWIWRGRVKSRWERLGYDRDAFKLMTQMKGAATRLRLLETLDTPMDRLQLSNKLGLDWKAIDRQTEVLCKYGLIREQEAYGKVKIYSLSENGKTMLKLIKELNVSESLGG